MLSSHCPRESCSEGGGSTVCAGAHCSQSTRSRSVSVPEATYSWSSAPLISSLQSQWLWLGALTSAKVCVARS